ncbi:transporter substrate-binding domain-containing protein, partial [Nonomuraea sp. NPDC005983]|uniref:transporter substrate-binding domain-containing protein n=1 Tax=Nonomuraea sp. NPDC005983 TaxID=3155595 RepID=UPI0033BF85FC
TAAVVRAAAAVVAVMNDWPPLAFGEQPDVTATGSDSKGPPPNAFASAVDKAAQTGRLVIGVKGDLPGVGLQEGDGFAGFDVDLARRIAAELGAEKVEFVRVSKSDRPGLLSNGTVDLVVATYSVNNDKVQFAGPYYLAHRDLLVRSGDAIDSIDDLEGKKICDPNSASVGDTQDKVKVELVPAQNYAECMDLLRSGEVAAVPGDDLILAGFASRENQRYKILGAKLNDERYAVGVKQGDAKTCKAVKAVIADLYRTGAFKKLVTTYFSKVDFTPELKVPAMEPCE